MSGAKVIQLLFLAVGLAIFAAWRLFEPPPEVVRDGSRVPAGELRGDVFGTTYSIKAPGCSASDLRLRAKVEAIFAAIDADMSTYRDDSVLMSFNRTTATGFFPVSRELVEVVEIAAHVFQRSKGAFDVTVQPLVKAWGFGRERGDERPNRATLTRLQGLVGQQHLETRSAPPALKKAVPRLQVDLSAVAKGYAVDAVHRELISMGCGSHLVEIGGEVWAQGRKADGSPWRVGVESPTEGLAQVLELNGVALATSGDYRNFRWVNGKRVSHTLDPRTGRPIEHSLASVSVITPESVALADAWATALNVLGPVAGVALAEEQNLAVLVLVRKEDGAFETRMTETFKPYIVSP